MARLTASIALLGAPGDAAVAAADAGGAQAIERVSVGSAGDQAVGGGPSFAFSSAVSNDGNVVAFASDASNLVDGDTNAALDVFVFDRLDRTTKRVSVGRDGQGSDGPSFDPALSGDGRWAAFASAATNLVDGDTNDEVDVFLHDLSSGVTSLVSVAAAGGPADGGSAQPALSSDAGVIAFASDATNLVPGGGDAETDIFKRTGTGTSLVSVSDAGGDANGPSQSPDIEDAGAKIAFESEASDLIPSDTNRMGDVFVAGPTAVERVNVPVVGAEADGPSGFPSISADGAFVAYESDASNIAGGADDGVLTAVFRVRLSDHDTERVSAAANDSSYSPSISGGGNLVAFSSAADNLLTTDTNAAEDVFVRDVAAGTVTRASEGSAGIEADGASAQPALAADGSAVAFESTATNLVEPTADGLQGIYVAATGDVTRVSGPGGSGVADGVLGSFSPAVAAGGAVVAFASFAPNLVPGDTNRAADVFVRRAGRTARVSVGPSGAQGKGHSGAVAITPDGRFVVFASSATNLVKGDPNGPAVDIYRHDLTSGATVRVSGPQPACEAAVSADGNVVAYTVGDACEFGGGASVAVKDMGTGVVTELQALGAPEPDGGSYSPAISADGRTVAFASDATNLVSGDENGVTDVFVWRHKLPAPGGGGLVATSIARVGGVEPDEASLGPSLSADGRTVAYASFATNLVRGDTNGAPDVFVTDLGRGATRRVSLSRAGAQADGASYEPALSADGQVVAFTSAARNLVPGEGADAVQVYRHDLRFGLTSLVGRAGDGPGSEPALSGDGKVAVYASSASNLVGGDTNGTADIFVADLDPAAGDGYWLVATDGGIFSYGTAPFEGSTGGLALNSPIVGLSAAAGGYRLVAADGGVFAFGGATFHGSTGHLRLTRPMVGIAATPAPVASGAPPSAGYWLVAADGGVFAFGDAGFFGSTGSIALNSPIVGMAPTASGSGYWLVAADGGVFAFGDAGFYGSTGDLDLTSPVAGLARTPSGLGYWLVAEDGGVFAFGDAGFFGSAAGVSRRTVVGMAPR